MADDRGKLTSFDWQELFPWTNLATALRLAVQPRVLVLAAVALIGTVAGWRICGSVCTQLFIGAEENQVDDRMPPGIGRVESYQDLPAVRHFESTIRRLTSWPWEKPAPAHGGFRDLSQSLTSWWTDSPVLLARSQIVAPFVGMFDPQASLEEFIFLVLCATWELVVWAFFGAAITRYAAIGLARDEQLSWGQVTSYARSKWSAYFTAPLFPLFGVLLATIPLAIFGLLLRFDLGLFVGGLFWFLVLLGGLFMAVLMVGLYFGWPLMWATISVEGTDSFDALSRCYAYTYQRPLHYLFYTIIAGLLGTLGWYVVAIFASATIALSSWGVSWFAGGDVAAEAVAGYAPAAFADYGWSALAGDTADAFRQGAGEPRDFVGETGLKLIGLWIGVVVTLALGFVFSFFWTSTTAIYFLLRRQVDATEMDEVYLPEERQPYGLPPLEPDSAGVPGAADMPAHGAADSADPK